MTFEETEALKGVNGQTQLSRSQVLVLIIPAAAPRQWLPPLAGSQPCPRSYHNRASKEASRSSIRLI